MRVYVLYWRGEEPVYVFDSLDVAMKSAEVCDGIEATTTGVTWSHQVDDETATETWVLMDEASDRPIVIELMKVWTEPHHA